jgi:hypothetical protein
MLIVRIAGWAYSVFFSSSSGPAKMILLRLKPEPLSDLSKTDLEGTKLSKRSLPIPTSWAPWPGKTMATSSVYSKGIIGL